MRGQGGANRARSGKDVSKSILIKYSKYAQVYQYRAIPAALAHKGIIDPNNVDETDKGPKY